VKKNPWFCICVGSSIRNLRFIISLKAPCLLALSKIPKYTHTHTKREREREIETDRERERERERTRAYQWFCLRELWEAGEGKRMLE
jgi:hypothetical protein